MGRETPMKRELYICDGLPGAPPCGTVIVEPEGGFVFTGQVLTAVTAPDQRVLIKPSEGATEVCLCRACFMSVVESQGMPKGG